VTRDILRIFVSSSESELKDEREMVIDTVEKMGYDVFASENRSASNHTLLTYPDLGHAFAPSSQLITEVGPIEQKVLEDIFGWLSDPVRDFKKMTILSSQVP
jgi:hypothetical protein